MKPLAALRANIRRAKSVDEVIQLAKWHAHHNGDMSPRAALNFARRLGFRKETALRIIDALTACHGVEAMQDHQGRYWEYANTGDSYAETVLLSPGGRFFVESWGDRVERSAWMKAP